QKTDVGQQRENNQDSIYTLTSFIASDGRVEPFGLFIVADGMGGYKGGEKASAIATRTAADYILRNLYLPEIVPDPELPQDPINDILSTAVSKANNEVLEQAPESGTTITAAILMGNQAYFAHVGDSRAYIYNAHQLSQVTQDHSVVARMVEVGQITPEEALTHKNRNVLYRAIGQTSTLEVDTYLHTIPANSYLLICSDGLWNLVTDDEINHRLHSPTSLDDCVTDLVDLANEKGGDDNISVILVGVGPEAG
ncbi:MAG: Stp1/IreP family PP2C-type Ser/Thr phosphatase, partial [Chloroflexota bacterium]